MQGGDSSQLLPSDHQCGLSVLSSRISLVAELYRRRCDKVHWMMMMMDGWNTRRVQGPDEEEQLLGQSMHARPLLCLSPISSLLHLGQHAASINIDNPWSIPSTTDTQQQQHAILILIQ